MSMAARAWSAGFRRDTRRAPGYSRRYLTPVPLACRGGCQRAAWAAAPPTRVRRARPFGALWFAALVRSAWRAAGRTTCCSLACLAESRTRDAMRENLVDDLGRSWCSGSPRLYGLRPAARESRLPYWMRSIQEQCCDDSSARPQRARRGSKSVVIQVHSPLQHSLHAPPRALP